MRWFLAFLSLFLSFSGLPTLQEAEGEDANNSCKGLNTKNKFDYNWFKCVVLNKEARKAICHSGKVQKEYLLRRIYAKAEVPLDRGVLRQNAGL